MELGAVDLLSLEPIDQDLRPLRLKAYCHNYSLVEQDYIQDSGNNMANIQRVCSRAYLGFRSLPDLDVETMVNQSQRTMDKCLLWCNRVLDCRLDLGQRQILMDRRVERGTWEVYYVFQQYVVHYIERLRSQVNKYVRSQNEGQDNQTHPLKDYRVFRESRYFCLRLIFQKAMKKAN